MLLSSSINKFIEISHFLILLSDSSGMFKIKKVFTKFEKPTLKGAMPLREQLLSPHKPGELLPSGEPVQPKYARACWQAQIGRQGVAHASQAAAEKCQPMPSHSSALMGAFSR